MPNVIVILSGKRKSGKDFIASKLCNVVGAERCGMVQLSAPLKFEFARENGLQYDELLKSSNYKELYRAKMIAWGEAKRKTDPECFCKLAIAPFLGKQIWIVTDARRKSDLAFFENNFHKTKLLLIRIQANKTTRIARGWQFVTGIDDAESECGLDEGVNWNVVINNDDDLPTDTINENILKITKIVIESCLSG